MANTVESCTQENIGVLLTLACEIALQLFQVWPIAHFLNGENRQAARLVCSREGLVSRPPASGNHCDIHHLPSDPLPDSFQGYS